VEREKERIEGRRGEESEILRRGRVEEAKEELPKRRGEEEEQEERRARGAGEMKILLSF
jgi:hypothetical protein